MEEEIPSTSREIKTDNKSFKKSCTLEEKEFVAEKIKPSEFRRFARFLGLEESKIDAVEMDCKINNYGFRETVYQMFAKWEQIKGCEATVEVLISGLNYIQRNDIVQDLFPDYPYASRCFLQDLKQIQENQKKDYRDLKLPTSLWLKKKWLPLDEFFVELSIVSKSKMGKEEHKPLDLAEIFDKVKKIIPRRILIEGHPGYGKTTLITKILSDWSGEEEYVKDKFDLVFVIPLRNYKGDLDQHLLRQCEGVKGKKEEVSELIAAIEDRVLLLLDGLDECNEKVKDSLIPLIKGDQHPNMTVVVTCRTGFFHLNIDSKEDFKSMGNKDFEAFSVWDKRIQIKGISSKKRKEFLQRYLNVEVTELDKKLDQSNVKLSEFYECPLFLLLLAVLLQEKNVKFTESKTELYKTIFNFIINRSLEKLEGDNKETDVFDIKALDQFGCRNLLINFGRLCLEKFEIRSLIFEEHELIECSGGNEMIFKLGILSKQNSFSFHEEKNYYEPIHKSFLEFLSAFYLSSLEKKKMDNEIKILLLDFDIWPQDDQLIYSFIGGILQSNVFKLFNALYPYRCLISIFNNDENPYNVSQILLEIPKSVEIVKSLANFPLGNFVKPSKLNKSFMSSWLIDLIKVNSENGTNRKIFFTLCGDTEFINALPEDFKVYNITVIIDDEITDYKLKNNKIQCENLVIRSEFSEYSNWKEVLTKIEAEKIWLDIDEMDFNKFYKEMIHGNLSQLRIYYLSIALPFKFPIQIAHSKVEDLVKRKKIQHGLSVRLFKRYHNYDNPSPYYFRSLKPMLPFKSIPDSLQFIDPFKQDSYLTLLKPTVLELRGGKCMIKNLNNFECFSVEHFMCYNCVKLVETNIWIRLFYRIFYRGFLISLPNLLLKCKDIKRLSCSYDLISKLSSCENSSSWKGFQTIERLDLWLDENLSVEDESFLRVLYLFTNIRELQLFNFTIDKHNFLINFISHCPLKKIYLKGCNDLITFIENLNQHQGIYLDELEIHFGILTFHYPVICFFQYLTRCLEECFSRHVFRKFSFIDAGQCESVVKLIKLFFDIEVFRVSFEIVENVDRNGFPKPKQKFIITYLHKSN